MTSLHGMTKGVLEPPEPPPGYAPADGPVLIVGDLNAHLGSRNDLNTNHTNHRGMQWNAVISEHNLSNVSLGSLSSGATYTYILLW